MEKLQMCRICLVQNVRMRLVVNRNFHELYEKLTDIPFVTEDKRPILACFFCCAKLEKCCQLMRKCLEAEEMFAQMMNEDYEPNPLINQDHLEYLGGFIKSPIENISIVDVVQTESIAIKEELTAVCEELDGITEPKEEHQSDAEIPPRHSESDLEDDVPLMQYKTELEEEQEVSKKKRRARETKSTRDKPIRHPKTYEEKPKPRKGTQGLPCQVTKDGLEMIEELKKHRTNLKEVLICSNTTPFDGVNYQGFLCCYCDSQYPDPAALKKHTRDNHKGLYNSVTPQNNKSYSGNTIDNFCINLDITGLRCTLCDTDINTLENLLKHLEIDHKRGIHADIKNQLIPFKFFSDTMECYVCLSKFHKFRALQQHMKIHYRNFVCDECDMGFITKASIRKHIASHVTGVYKCNLCSKTFETKYKAQYHEKSVHVYKHMMTKCGYCNERFKNYMRRDAHLVEIHGVKLKVVKCHACDRTFPNRSALRIHTRRDHLMERRFKCTQCDKAFFQAADVKFHMVTHTKTREFQCTVCLKSYGRKETLRQHMEIHSDIRRFKCEHCGQAFVQKASWKGHMKNRHGEVV